VKELVKVENVEVAPVVPIDTVPEKLGVLGLLPNVKVTLESQPPNISNVKEFDVCVWVPIEHTISQEY